MVSDIVKTIKAQLYDRVSSPLFVAFVISWSLWNYRFLMVLVSSLPVHLKFRFIETNLFPDIWSKLLQGGLYPLFTTALIIFVYPFPAKIVYEFWRKRQKDLMLVRQQIEDETPLTLEESRLIRNDLLVFELEHQNEIEKRDGIIKNLKELLGEGVNNVIKLENKNNQKIEFSETEEPELNETQADLLSEIANTENWKAFESHLMIKSKTEKIITRYNLDFLVSKNLIKARYIDDDDSKNTYKLTPSGRNLLVKSMKLRTT